MPIPESLTWKRAARKYFEEGRRLSGLLAAERDEHATTQRRLDRAVQFLAEAFVKSQHKYWKAVERNVLLERQIARALATCQAQLNHDDWITQQSTHAHKHEVEARSIHMRLKIQRSITELEEARKNTLCQE